MLAGELGLQRARVIVLDRLAEATGQSRGLGFTARAVETFDQRGLLPRFGEPELSMLGHFGGVQFDYSVLTGAHFGARGIPQSKTEAVLADWAVSLGADVRRGWEFEEADDLGDRVEAVFRTPDGPRRLTAAYLVGCDGGGSTVRKAGGFSFPGSSATRGMYLADVIGCGLRPRFLGERGQGGMVMAAPLGDDVDRVIVVEHGAAPPKRTETPGFTEVADAWRRITGEDISHGRASWVGAFTDAARQATEYRRGRILLAGDAAHIHLPAGGQGLSTGVQDAANLGWKLAGAVQGRAPKGLLDSYHAERHPVGARLLMNTTAQGMLYVGGPEMDALRGLFGELIEHDDVKRHLAGMVSGLDVRYDVGGEEHPLVGRRIPNRLLYRDSGPERVFELLHPGRGVLLDLVGDPALRATAVGWRSRVRTMRAAYEPAHGDDPLTGAAAVLIRPDGYVAAVVGSPDERGARKLDAALHRWFGTPSALRQRVSA
jgi:bifunctional hydroxylase/dehydrase